MRYLDKSVYFQNNHYYKIDYLSTSIPVLEKIETLFNIYHVQHAAPS